MSRMKIVVGILLLLVVVAGCAPGPNTMADVPDEEGEVAGFWLGLWHGFASPFMFIVSLFNESVEVYEVHNNGGWYTFGFLLGARVFFSAVPAVVRVAGAGATGTKRTTVTHE